MSGKTKFLYELHHRILDNEEILEKSQNWVET